MGEFLQFVGTLRSNNLGIPILVGGDFNMDMKSYDMEQYKDLSIVPYRYSTVQYSTVQYSTVQYNNLSIVPYRPLSGKNVMRDLRNTFLFTMDALQVIIKSAEHLKDKPKSLCKCHVASITYKHKCKKLFV